jgi:hypothetical protein
MNPDQPACRTPRELLQHELLRRHVFRGGMLRAACRRANQGGLRTVARSRFAASTAPAHRAIRDALRVLDNLGASRTVAVGT